ncbi:MAG: NAD(P)H-binding protein, partial [Agrococcus sp.]
MILVVGGTGRLGRLVVEELVARHDVRVLARRATAATTMDIRVEPMDGDVRDASAVVAAAQGVSCIVVASHGVESRERDGLETVDVDGARAVAA